VSWKKGKATKGVRSDYNMGRSELFVNNQKKERKTKKKVVDSVMFLDLINVR
jgi:hypothetical protein